MTQLDVDACLEIFFQLIPEQGSVAFRFFWDSGGPGAGAGEEVIYRFRDLYWPADSDQGFIVGPFDSLKKAMKGLVEVNDATKRIACDEMSLSALLKALPVSRGKAGHVVEVNGKKCKVSTTGRLVRQ